MEQSYPISRLSKRERECLRGVLQLKGSKEIANDLGLKEGTVDSYISDAMRKLGARTRREAAQMLAMAEAPENYGSRFPGVLDPPAYLPDTAPQLGEASPPTDRANRLRDVSSVLPSWDDHGLDLPVPTQRRPVNRLTPMRTIFWICIVLFGAVVTIGVAVTAAEGLARIIWLGHR